MNAGVPFKECKTSYTDYLDYWLDNYCKINLKYNTIQAYKNIIEKHIIPKLGKYRLSTITSVRLNSYITELVEENDFALTYFKNILKVLKGSFRDACDVYGFIKYNPARDLRLPRFDKRREDIKHLYTQKEIDKILLRFKNNNTFICAFLTACYTGMRTGEVFALTWSDIDLDNRIIKINKTVYAKDKEANGRWYLGTAKTIGSYREVYICDTLYSFLLKYKELQNNYKKECGKKYKHYTLEENKKKVTKVFEYEINKV